jgi:flagellar biosynthesis GTPase FlhF
MATNNRAKRAAERAKAAENRKKRPRGKNNAATPVTAPAAKQARRTTAPAAAPAAPVGSLAKQLVNATGSSSTSNANTNKNKNKANENKNKANENKNKANKNKLLTPEQEEKIKKRLENFAKFNPEAIKEVLDKFGKRELRITPRAGNQSNQRGWQGMCFNTFVRKPADLCLYIMHPKRSLPLLLVAAAAVLVRSFASIPAMGVISQRTYREVLRFVHDNWSVLTSTVAGNASPAITYNSTIIAGKFPTITWK